MNKSGEVTLLLVEDDPGHARLIEKNLRRASIANPIIILEDGQRAVDFIFSTGEYEGKPHPSPLLVLLDLNLPVLDGYQVLKRMKEDQRTKCIPVIILTTTAETREIEKCYQLGCNVYLNKPVEYDKFSQAIQNMGLFISVIKIPDGE